MSSTISWIVINRSELISIRFIKSTNVAAMCRSCWWTVVLTSSSTSVVVVVGATAQDVTSCSIFSNSNNVHRVKYLAYRECGSDVWFIIPCCVVWWWLLLLWRRRRLITFERIFLRSFVLLSLFCSSSLSFVARSALIPVSRSSSSKTVGVDE